MQQLVINITNESKAKFLINFLKQLDFVEIEEISKQRKVMKMQKEILESMADLKSGKVSSWNNKKVTLRNA